MKKIFSFSGAFISMLFFAQQAFAVCTLNGEVVPCDQMPKWPFVLMILFFIFMMLTLVFWVWMIIDVAKYEKENTVVWVLVVVLAQVIGAAIYYFVRHRKRIKEAKTITSENNSSKDASTESEANSEMKTDIDKKENDNKSQNVKIEKDNSKENNEKSQDAK